MLDILMKKKKIASKKVAPRARVNRSAPKTTVSYRRIIFITSSFVLVLFAIVLLNKRELSQSVAGMSITRGLYNQATVAWNPIPGAIAYNIYYKQDSEATFTHAVRRIPVNITNYTISYLKKDTSYQYKVVGIDIHDAEMQSSQVLSMNNVTSM